MVAPIWIDTNRTGATRIPAMPPSTALYTKVSMIMRATGMPRSDAISLSCEVACSFLPSSVCSKNQYWTATKTAVTAMIRRYWLSRKTLPSCNPGVSNQPGRTWGSGP